MEIRLQKSTSKILKIDGQIFHARNWVSLIAHNVMSLPKALN
jgi:hypothetical protein